MFIVAFFIVLLALWFGFELGRKWQEGVEEEAREALAETHSNGRIRLNSITIRR